MGRLTFLDAFRGFALVLMVLNHTSRDWMDGSVMGWGRYYLVYGSLLLPAPIFLFLVGFCLPIGYHQHPTDESLAVRARHAFRRGIVIIAAGYVLNLLITPEQPLWNGGVLETIGLAIVLLGPALPLLRSARARWMLTIAAVLWYLAFVAAVPALIRWTWAHPVGSRALFNDFPPWPWLSAAVLGLVLGWTWLDARARGARDERRFFTRVALSGAACVAVYIAWELVMPTTPRFGFPRDFSVNRHWTPRGVTTLLVLGAIGLLLALFYWAMERHGLRVGWLVVLGRTAFMLYFTHQLIEMTLVSKMLGLRFNSWPLYGVMNVLFVALLVGLGRLWLAVKGLPGWRRAAPRP